MDDHCHCPATMDHCHPPSPPPCQPEDSSCWNTANHCHPPCPPPPYEQQDYFSWNPAFRPALHPFPGLWSSSSSDSDASCTVVRVETPPLTTMGDKAPLLESNVQGGGTDAAAPSATGVVSVLLFWAAVAGLLYWYRVL